MISIIIVNYNVEEHLKQCLNSIMQAQNYEKYEIIIVDNNSFDNSVKSIKKSYPFVKLIELPSNLGYSKAVNLGADVSTNDLICLLNPDTIVNKNTFEILSEQLSQNSSNDIVGCKVLNANGSFQLASRRKFPSFLVSLCKMTGLNKLFPKSKYFGQYNYTFISENEIQSVDAVNGACIMFKRNVYDKLNGLDESFFLYFEDTDFCYRAKKQGFRVTYFPNTSIIHYKGESHSKAPFNINKIFLQSMVTFYKKHKKEFMFWRLINSLLPIAVLTSKLFNIFKLKRDLIFSVFADILLVIFSFSSTLLGWFSYKYNKAPTFELITNHLLLLIAMLFSWTIATKLTKLYSKNHLSYARSVVATVIMFLILTTLTYFLSFFAYSRVVLILSTIIVLFTTAIWRILIHYLVHNNKLSSTNSTLFARNAVIIGASSETIRIGNAILNSPYNDFKLIGYVADHRLESPNLVGLGRLYEIKDIIELYSINEIIIPEHEMSFENIIKLLEEVSTRNVSIKLAPNGKDTLIGKGMIENISGIPLLNMDIPILDTFHIKAKRIFDFIFSTFLIILTFPIMLFLLLTKGKISIKIWTTDGSFIKLIQFKSSKNIFNKLPYLFSIMKGDISFVGSQICKSTFSNPNLLVKPGLTGLAQIKQTTCDVNGSTLFDHYYMQNQSFMYDIEILFKSILKV